MRKHVKGNVSWVGYLDWELETFHGDDYSIFHGSSQNAYLIEEEKTILVDTVWTPHHYDFIQNLKSEIDLKKIDAIIVNHGEADHSGALPALLAEIPGTPIYCTAMAVKSLEGQYGKQGWNFHVVKTGDELDIGNGKKLQFVEMRMLHWPDSMAEFMTGDNILFSMDAFGQHYATSELFADLAEQDVLWHEALKYFVNILNPFAALIPRKLDEIAKLNLPIEMIAPSHGAIWREKPFKIIEKYAEWAKAYQEDQVTVVYDTMWHSTEKMAYAIADGLNAGNVETVVMPLSGSHRSDVARELLDSKALIVGSPTLNQGMMPSVADVLTYIKGLKFPIELGAVFGSYGWAPLGAKALQDFIAPMAQNMTNPMTVQFVPTQDDLAKCRDYGEELAHVLYNGCTWQCV